MRSVVVFSEVGEARGGGGEGREVCAVEEAWVVGSDRAAEGRARVEGDKEEVGRKRGGVGWGRGKRGIEQSWDWDQVRAFRDCAWDDEARMCDV